MIFFSDVRGSTDEMCEFEGALHFLSVLINMFVFDILQIADS